MAFVNKSLAALSYSESFNSNKLTQNAVKTFRSQDLFNFYYSDKRFLIRRSLLLFNYLNKRSFRNILVILFYTEPDRETIM